MDYNVYIGKLFAGSQFTEFDVIYDTVNSWTVLSEMFDVGMSQTS